MNRISTLRFFPLITVVVCVIRKLCQSKVFDRNSTKSPWKVGNMEEFVKKTVRIGAGSVLTRNGPGLDWLRLGWR